ncbi:hypothetical protein ACF1G0_13270 [Streptomyces sp. NPDC013953]|uniref:hypothetical protein n=1 Tax=Streptomyces sp. NPDC013953 TaxID=3364868 RepID=UPI0036F6E224
MALFLFLVLVAIILGLIGVVVEGLMFLLVIGIIVLVVDIVFVAVRRFRRSRPLR